MKIRIGKQEDKLRIAEVYRSAIGRAAKFDEASCDWLLSQQKILVAQVDSQIIGFGGIDVSAVEQLRWLYLIPKYQRTGIGSKILEQLESMASEAGLRSVRLHSSPDAVSFYLKHGYREVESAQRVRHDHDGVEMVKDLAQWKMASE